MWPTNQLRPTISSASGEMQHMCQKEDGSKFQRVKEKVLYNSSLTVVYFGGGPATYQTAVKNVDSFLKSGFLTLYQGFRHE